MPRDALMYAFGRRHRKRVTALGLVAALLGAAAIAAATAQAALPPAPAYYPVTVHAPKGQEQGRWAERVKVAGDLNRDGVNDFWIAVPRYQRDNPSDPSDTQTYGRVYTVDDAPPLRTSKRTRDPACAGLGHFAAALLQLLPHDDIAPPTIGRPPLDML